MRALARSPIVSALAGSVVVAAALVTIGGVGHKRSNTTTVLEPAPAGGTIARDVAVSTLTPHDIYERDAPGVVFVRARSLAQTAAVGEREEASGTGFVLDADGHILTNRHVVGTAREVDVEFDDERTVVASVLGEDPTNDLAILQVDPGSVALQPLKLGDSDGVRVGDPVLAIGNPFGLDRTLATGVVTSLGRQLRAPNGFTIENAIQTDTPIDADNSGGPLLDGDGRVVGIATEVAGGAGVGYAVPIDTAKRLLPELRRSGRVSHAYLGITGMTIDAALDGAQPRTRHGVLVQVVFRGSPAARAGVRGGSVESQIDGARVQLGGDVITSLDGSTIDSAQELTAAIARHDPGDEIRLGIVRDGATLQLAVRLARAPKQVPAETAAP